MHALGRTFQFLMFSVAAVLFGLGGSAQAATTSATAEGPVKIIKVQQQQRVGPGGVWHGGRRWRGGFFPGLGWGYPGGGWGYPGVGWGYPGAGWGYPGGYPGWGYPGGYPGWGFHRLPGGGQRR